MDLKQTTLKAQRLRRQLSELQAKTEQTQQELNAVNQQLKQALHASGDAVSEMSEDEFQMILAECNDPKMITVEVVYATRDKQLCNEIQLSRGATIEDGIFVSGVLQTFPEIDLGTFKVGIYGSLKTLSDPLQEGDRVEIYRPIEAGTRGPDA